jgi:hypothetical protein
MNVAGDKGGKMLARSVGTVLLAAVLLTAGLVGIAAFWAVWPRTSDTSPLAAIFTLAWSCAYIAAGVLTWRRSRLAAPAFVAAVALLVILVSFVFPGSQLPIFLATVVISLLAFLGYRYLRRASDLTARSA